MEAKPKKTSLTVIILISLAAGILFGLLLNWIISISDKSIGTAIDIYMIKGLFHFFGQAFIQAIKMLVVPLVLVSMVCGVTGIGDISKLGRVGGKTLAFYLATTGVAISLALGIGLLIDPGKSVDTTNMAKDFKASQAPSIIQVFLDIIPNNPIEALAKGEMLQIIFFAILLGLAIASLGKSVQLILNFFHKLNDVVMKMVTFVMLTAPIGVFCLVAKVTAEQGLDMLSKLVVYILTVLLVLLIHMSVVYGGMFTIFSRLSFFQFIKKMSSPMLVAFSTSSSNATIPVTMKALVERMGVSRGVASFTVPFGATINMDGTAIMQGVAVIFIAGISGKLLTPTDYLMVIITATLASVGTAGVPGVGMITLSMVLTQVDLPVESISLIFGVDRILDMSRTVVNVVGDSAVTVIVAKSEGEFDRSVFDDPNAGLAAPDDILEELEENLHEAHDILAVEDNKTKA